MKFPTEELIEKFDDGVEVYCQAMLDWDALPPGPEKCAKRRELQAIRIALIQSVIADFGDE